jgi:hypothetical protein
MSTTRGVAMHLLRPENEPWLVREPRSSKYEVRSRYTVTMLFWCLSFFLVIAAFSVGDACISHQKEPFGLIVMMLQLI